MLRIRALGVRVRVLGFRFKVLGFRVSGLFQVPCAIRH